MASWGCCWNYCRQLEFFCCASSRFFFSSRRRHTRFDCDWSSDVCSSDLLFLQALRDLALRMVDDQAFAAAQVAHDGVARHGAAALRVVDGALVGAVQQHGRSEEHTSELQSQSNLVCRLLLEKKKDNITYTRLYAARTALE